ncbi:MAG: 4'-phosphopantetheinyl transferase superfamily protein [Vicingaceae bacterium]
MASWRKHIFTDSHKLGIWHIEESLPELLSAAGLKGYDIESQVLFKNELKQKQWLAARLLLWSLDQNAGRIYYDENGAPYLNDGTFISMTHSFEKVALILDYRGETGIDLQHLSPKIQRISHKFASERELELCNSTDSIQRLTLIWCAKEAIFKKMKTPGLIFKEEIAVYPSTHLTDKGSLTADVLRKGIQSKLKLNYEILDQYILVYCLNG